MIRVRFAPSPTGYLHLGNIRTALFNYIFAKQKDGRFVLRVEDTDQERSKEEFLESQLEDLSWLGIQWDEGPGKGGDYQPYRQSERMDLYKKYIEDLLSKGLAYECYVTEQETEEMKTLARLEKRPPRFDNRGRSFTGGEIEKRKACGIKPTVRFRIDNPMLELQDLIRGKVAFNLDDMVGDFVIQRADGMPTFHLAVCVDDGLMKISHVIRGEDHLSNTPKHILLLRAMGFEPPQYGHLSLVHGQGGEPLSKRLSAVSIREFRKQGYLPAALANYICLLGWGPGDDREILTQEELMKAFDVTKVSRSASNFDPDKLNWVNGQHLRLLPDKEFVKLALGYLEERGNLKYDKNMLRAALPVYKDNIERFDQLDNRLEIFSEEFNFEDESLLKTTDGVQIMEIALAAVEKVDWKAENAYETFVNAIKPNVKAKGKNLFHPLRMALTGRAHGPELKKLFPVLGADLVRARLEKAVKVSKVQSHD